MGAADHGRGLQVDLARQQQSCEERARLAGTLCVQPCPLYARCRTALRAARGLQSIRKEEADRVEEMGLQRRFYDVAECPLSLPPTLTLISHSVVARSLSLSSLSLLCLT